MGSHVTVGWWSGTRQRIATGAVVVAGMTAAIVTIIHELWRVPLRVPLLYAGDANWYLAIVKGLTDGHWYYTNDQLGFPFGSELFDFPTGDHLQLLLYKGIASLVGNDPVLAVNLGYLAGFVAIAVIAYLVVCALGVRPMIAGLVGILFAFLPDHFVRGTGHLFLSGYFAVPLAVLVILRQYDRPAFSLSDPSHPTGARWSWKDPWGWLAVAFLLIVGTTGFYYAIFTGLFLLATMVLRIISERDRVAGVSTLFLCLVLGLALLGDLAATFFYQAANGINEIAVSRQYREVEFYGLKPIQMLLPSLTHRIASLRTLMAESLVPGQAPQSLGLVASIGLVAIVTRSLARIGIGAVDEPHSRTLDRLGTLTTGSILGATTAGFAAGLGLIGFTHIRAWDRISIFLGFFALAVVALFIDRWARKRQLGLGVLAPVAIGIMIVGVLDQTPAPSPAADAARIEQWESDQAFFEAVEAAMAPGAAIFQLPQMAYPEVVPPNLMIDYDHLRGYIHTENLNWSYGAMKGRAADWQPRIEAMEAESRLETIVLMGFDGLYIDRFGYPDMGAALESDISRLTGIEPIVSQDDRMAFYDLSAFAADVRTRTPSETRAALVAALQMPAIQVEYGVGFHGLESDGVRSWSWASEEAELILNNPSANERHVSLAAALQTGFQAPSAVSVEVAGRTEHLRASSTMGCLLMEFDLPPGPSVVTFTNDAERLDAPGDERDLRLRVLDVMVDDAATIRRLQPSRNEPCL